MNNFPAHLECEWQAFVSFKTRAYPPDGFERNGSWRLRHGKSVTANINKAYLSSFFGYLCLNSDNKKLKLRGLDFPHDRLSLALLGDKSLVERYIEFKRHRAGNKYTSETISFLSLCASLLRAGTGYLAQHPEFGDRLTEKISIEDWDVWCEAAYKRFVQLKKHLNEGNRIRQGRDVEEPLRAILSERQPLTVLKKFRDSVEFNAPPNTADLHARAIHKRNLLLIDMLISNPLRVKHFSMMNWREDNKGNLYQKADGSWWLRFKARDFKNERGAAAANGYDVEIVDYLWKDIETYLIEHRDNLLGDVKSNLVFVRSSRCLRRSLKHSVPQLKPQVIGRLLRALTQAHIPGCPGFGPHGFRHIVATHYIKNHIDGYELVARILHNRVETVRRAYDHVTQSEHHAHWNHHLKELMSK